MGVVWFLNNMICAKYNVTLQYVVPSQYSRTKFYWPLFVSTMSLSTLRFKQKKIYLENCEYYKKIKKALPRTSYLCCSSKQCLEIHIRGSCTFYDLINYLDLIPWCISLWQKCNENLFDFHLLPEYGLKEDDTEFVLCVFNVYILDV